MAFKLNSHLENIFVRAFGTPKELSLGETKQLSINIELFQVFCSTGFVDRSLIHVIRALAQLGS